MKKKSRESWQNGSCQLCGLSQFQEFCEISKSHDTKNKRTYHTVVYFTKICAVGTHTQTICLTESLNVSDSSIPRFFAPFIARFAQLLGDDSFARCRFNSLFVTRAFLSFPFLLGRAFESKFRSFVHAPFVMFASGRNVSRAK
jgi:hypothetical protein